MDIQELKQHVDLRCDNIDEAIAGLHDRERLDIEKLTRADERSKQNRWVIGIGIMLLLVFIGAVIKS